MTSKGWCQARPPLRPAWLEFEAEIYPLGSFMKNNGRVVSRIRGSSADERLKFVKDTRVGQELRDIQIRLKLKPQFYSHA
jgi:hypothetical protein